MEIRVARPQDLTAWVGLVDPIRQVFPGLETDEAMEGYARDIAGAIARREGLCAWEGETLRGVLVFSQEKNELSFLAVAPEGRRKGAARQLIEAMLAELDPTRPVTLITYREDDPEGLPARALYRAIGFREGALVLEDGVPAQEFVRPASQPAHSQERGGSH